MNNLTTRKIILGLLMTCVLAFGVQGVVNAVTTTLPEGPTVDIDANVVNGLVSLTIPNISAETVTTGEDDPTQTIRISTSNIQLTVPDFVTSVTLSNNPTGTQRPYSDNTVTGYFRSVGVASITVTYTDLATDAEKATDPPTQTSNISRTHRYTYYVVRADSAIPDGTMLRLTQDGRSVNSEGYITGLDGRRDFYIQSGSGDYPVTYSVTPTDRGLFTGATFADRVTPTDTETIASRVRVWLSMNGSTLTDSFNLGTTSVVRVRIGNDPADPVSDYNVVYIIGTPELDIGLTAGTDITAEVDATDDEYSFTGGDAGDDAGTITAMVTDGAGTPVSGVLVKFDVVDKTVRGGYVSLASNGGTIVNARNAIPETSLSFGRTLYVRTNDGTGGTTAGEASVTYQLGTASGEQEIRVTSVGKAQTVTAALASSERPQKLFIKSNQRQGSTEKYDLVAEVKDGDNPVAGMTVLFRTNRGTLTRVSAAPGTDAISTTKTVNVQTNDLGEAQVIYDIGDNTGRQEIHASIYDEDDTTTTGIDERIFRQEVTFVINGSASPRQPPPTTTQARLTITVNGTGTTRAVTVTAINAQGVNIPGLAVALTGTALTTPRVVNTGTPTVITLPTTPGDYTIIATLSGYESDTETITVGTPTRAGTLTLTLGARSGNQQPVTVTATSGGSPQDVSYTLRVGSLVYTGQTGEDGSASRVIALPTATSSHTLTLSAAGYTTVEATAPAPGQQRDDTTPSGPAGEADSIRIDGQRLRSGTVNEQLDASLRVRVVDANGRGVSDVRVTFRVLSPGRGTFPGARGSGQATQDETDSNGYASVTFTPTSTGNVTVRATAAKVSDPVTFIISVSEASDTGTRDVDVAPSREISPVVHVGAAQRPPMLWVDGGKIYALVGADVQEFRSGIDNALNIAVGGGKVYWTEKTGDSAGTINSANLNGSNVQELASILAVPMGIAVDATNSKLYWTNSRGRIQSANLDGSRIQNVLQNLPGPKDIAVARGNVYWTQYDTTGGEGNVGILNPTAQQKIARYISTGSDTPGSLVIGNGKVYWTEMTGESGGTINSANLAGTGARQLASILAAPSGIAVDGSRSKLYWTNARGRVQSANLDGSKIQNVVSGLGSPGDMVLSNSIAAPATTPTTSTTSTTASKSKYDVNGDGTVDNTDAGLVSDALGTNNAKYDVNGDGTVNFLDLLLVFDNRDDGAASAPTVLGMKLSAAQIDVIEEQIDLLIATGDRSPAAMRTLIYLQQLIATARPEKTQLLANYPNPFNPETWIPYELATDTNVRITIYNTQGIVIRTLELGHQAAGYYTGRDRAAYWDGRNAFGEQVASGIYFYQFETDEMSSMRKMVILK